MKQSNDSQPIFQSNLWQGSIKGCLSGILIWPVLIEGLVIVAWATDAIMGLLNPAYHSSEFAPLGFLLTLFFAIITAPIGGIIGAVIGFLAVLVASKVRTR